MKFFLTSLFMVLLVVAFAGCKRPQYQMGNVEAPKSPEAPEYSVKPDGHSSVKTR